MKFFIIPRIIKIIKIKQFLNRNKHSNQNGNFSFPLMIFQGKQRSNGRNGKTIPNDDDENEKPKKEKGKEERTWSPRLGTYVTNFSS